MDYAEPLSSADVHIRTRKGPQHFDRKDVLQVIAFICAFVNCLCINSIGTFSLYGPQFLSTLQYSQLQVNAVSIAGLISQYVSFPFVGVLCDRTSPKFLALLCAIFGGLGYILAAYTFRAGPPASGGWPVVSMICAFLGIGFGTANIYIASLTALAKNFEHSRFRGFMLAFPITAIGVSQIWMAQIGVRVFCQRLPNGQCGDVDVFQYFIFLGIAFGSVGLLSVFGLRIVEQTYAPKPQLHTIEAESLLGNQDTSIESTTEVIAKMGRARSGSLARARKLFLHDRAMWYLTAGLVLIAGPAEAYISNLGTIIPSLDGGTVSETHNAGQASTHISLLASTSTLARLLGGSIVDCFSSPSRRSTEISFAHVAILLMAALLTLGGFVNLAIVSPLVPSFFYISSIFLGVGYGTTFSLIPIMVSIAWGAESFGTNWGLIATSPATSIVIFSILYSMVYSSHTPKDRATQECVGYECFGLWAWVCAISIGIAICFWIKTWTIWNRRYRTARTT